MPRRGTYTTFETGIDLGPWLTQTLVESLTPKRIRKQAAEQTALEKLAELQPAISKLPEDEKEQFYRHFHEAYGFYQPPLLRGIFGAGEEPILPLPKGSRTERRVVSGPLGLIKRMQTNYIVPTPETMKFSEPVTLSPQKEAELSTFADKYYPGDEDAKAAILREAATGRWTTADERTAATLRRAEVKLQELMAGGLTEEEAIQRLPLPLQNIYRQTVEKRKVEKGLAESLEEDRVARQREAKERETRLKLEGEQRIAFRRAQLDLLNRKQKFLEENTKAAQSAKNSDQLMKNAHSAFSNYRNFVVKWNGEETTKEKQALMAGRDYLPNYLPVPTWEGWLADEGAEFQRRSAELEAQGEKGKIPPSAKPETSTKKPHSDAFNEIVNQFFK